MVDLRQTPEYAKYLKSLGWVVERIDKTNYFVRKFPIIGSVIKIQRPKVLSYKVIELLSKKHRAFEVVFEPKDRSQELRIKTYGFRLSNSPYLPTKTLEINLTKTLRELFGELRKDCKYALRKTQDSGRIETVENIGKFRDGWKKSVGFRRHIPPKSHLSALKNSFAKNFLLLQCNSRLKQKAVAGAVFLVGGQRACYWQAFTGREGRKNLVQYKIVWEGILWAKKRGAKIFDFEGIYDERFPNKKWLGFSHFKKSFGGKEVEYPGTYVKWSILNWSGRLTNIRSFGKGYFLSR